MKKRILCLIMTMILIIGAPLSVNAASQTATPSNEKEWTVNYDGKNMKTEVAGGASLDLSIPTQLPSGDFYLTANITNTSSNRTDWYMSNEILDTLEKTSKNGVQGSGAGYTYLLTYHEPTANGPKTTDPLVIYNSSVVGGETPMATGEVGLEEVKDLENYFYVDRLSPGETAAIKLYVKLDGTTVTNDYQDTLAKLQLNFAVEKLLEGTITKEVERINTETLVQYVPTMVQTGDDAPVAILSTLSLGSAAVLIVLAVKTLLRRKNEKGELQ